jgi:hypothetical protein
LEEDGEQEAMNKTKARKEAVQSCGVWWWWPKGEQHQDRTGGQARAKIGIGVYISPGQGMGLPNGILRGLAFGGLYRGLDRQMKILTSSRHAVVLGEAFQGVVW